MSTPKYTMADIKLVYNLMEAGLVQKLIDAGALGSMPGNVSMEIDDIIALLAIVQQAVSSDESRPVEFPSAKRAKAHQ
jgi:hypothetical protein